MKTLTHIAIRLSDQTYNLPSTVVPHNLVSCRQGAVWIGKPDRALTPGLVATLNEQIEAGYPTYLFIIAPQGVGLASYQAEIQKVSLKSPQDKDLVPAFYKELKILSRIKTCRPKGRNRGPERFSTRRNVRTRASQCHLRRSRKTGFPSEYHKGARLFRAEPGGIRACFEAAMSLKADGGLQTIIHLSIGRIIVNETVRLA